MFLPEKCTASRGRSVVPCTRLRMRLWRIWVEIRLAMLLNGLALLAANLFARVSNAFALVRLRRVVAADVGSNLADQFLVDPFHLDLRILGHRDLDPLWNG